uniref:Uncharacterized protein n=1 Tax=Arundo donax TaxID=35708 RepID=A0A0A9EQ27_ARUDO
MIATSLFRTLFQNLFVETKHCFFFSWEPNLLSKL